MKISEILKALNEAEIKYLVEKTDECNISGFSSLFQYKYGTMTFVAPERKFADFQNNFCNKEIALMIIGKSETVYSCFKNAIRVGDPRKAFFTIIEKCFDTGNGEEVTGISSNPEVYKKNSYISPKAIIGKNVKIGIGCVIEGNVIIGDDTELHHNVVIRNKTKIGNRCMIHSGVVIGEFGFGYTVDSHGAKTMLKHYGGVTIEDDVHIGDNSVIIRGAIDDTLIHKGVKANTMVHIAHNDEIGENTIITSPVHICGSVKIGKNSHIAGSIIRNVVRRDVPDHCTVVGNPAKILRK